MPLSRVGPTHSLLRPLLTVSSLAQNIEYTTETREELLYNKEKLLCLSHLVLPFDGLTDALEMVANGDRMEAEIAANLHADHGQFSSPILDP